MASTQTAWQRHQSNGTNTPYIASELPKTNVNVSQTERLISALGGGALTFYGITRKDWLGVILALAGSGLILRGTTGYCPVYKQLQKNPDDEQQLTANISTIPGDKGIRVHRTVTVNRTAADAYALWHDIEKAPLYMPHITEVTSTGDRTSRWIGVTPGGKTVEWNSELLQDKPGQLISWHAHGKPAVANAGKVTFKPATNGRGTEITLVFDYFQARGLFGLVVGKIIGRLAEFEVMETLRRFKELLEAGEIPSIKGQPTGEGRK